MGDMALRNVLSKITTVENRVSILSSKTEQCLKNYQMTQNDYIQVRKQLQSFDRQFNSISLEINTVGRSIETYKESFSNQLQRFRNEYKATVETMLQPTIDQNNKINEQVDSLCDAVHLVDDRSKLNSELLQSIKNKVEHLQKQAETTNGYIASNNFMSNNPTQDQLTNFVIECLQLDTSVNGKENIPNGTKIKNTFDNHIWVFNRVSVSGLTTCKWQDFGSDTICVASNDGVYGLVTGSDERYEGKIDLRGIITINGLKEDIQSLMDNLQATNSIVEQFLQRITILESRVRSLEDNRL